MLPSAANSLCLAGARVPFSKVLSCSGIITRAGSSSRKVATLLGCFYKLSIPFLGVLIRPAILVSVLGSLILETPTKGRKYHHNT